MFRPVNLSILYYTERIFSTLFQFQSQFIQLLLIYQPRCFTDHALCVLIFRESDDFTDGFFTCQQHYKTIQSICQTAVWRCTVFKCLYQEAEFFIDSRLIHIKSAEHIFLHFLIMDTDASAAQLNAVVTDVIEGVAEADKPNEDEK